MFLMFALRAQKNDYEPALLFSGSAQVLQVSTEERRQDQLPEEGRHCGLLVHWLPGGWNCVWHQYSRRFDQSAPFKYCAFYHQGITPPPPPSGLNHSFNCVSTAARKKRQTKPLCFKVGLGRVIRGVSQYRVNCAVHPNVSQAGLRYVPQTFSRGFVFHVWTMQ